MSPQTQTRTVTSPTNKPLDTGMDASLTEEDTREPHYRLLLHCPEITLKGKNQAHFEEVLWGNARHRLLRTGMDWPVRSSRGRICVDVRDPDPEIIQKAAEAMKQLAGVESLAAAIYLRPSLINQHAGELNRPLIEQTILRLAREHFIEHASFAVRVNRVDKRFKTSSKDMENWLGAAIIRDTPWHRVDLGHPDRQFRIDIYPDGMYCSAQQIPGIGGLPVGTGGKALALLSGGIDSPVAAFLMAKRGCNVDFFHMSASHAQQRDEQSVVARLARKLSEYTLRSRLFTTPYTYFDLALGGAASGFEMILFRRFLARVAMELGGKYGAQALISGDSLGQVASQTMENLVSTSLATEMPVLRPLIASNKQETITLARKIGTFETSIEPYKDCCALIARQPRTRSRHEQLARLEKKLLPDYENLVEKTLAEVVWRDYDCGKPRGPFRPLEDIPRGE